MLCNNYFVKIWFSRKWPHSKRKGLILIEEKQSVDQMDAPAQVTMNHCWQWVQILHGYWTLSDQPNILKVWLKFCNFKWNWLCSSMAFSFGPLTNGWLLVLYINQSGKLTSDWCSQLWNIIGGHIWYQMKALGVPDVVLLFLLKNMSSKANWWLLAFRI